MYVVDPTAVSFSSLPQTKEHSFKNLEVMAFSLSFFFFKKRPNIFLLIDTNYCYNNLVEWKELQVRRQEA